MTTPKTLHPAPTQADPSEVAGFVVTTYGKAKGGEYIDLMIGTNRRSGCQPAVIWWQKVRAAIEQATEGGAPDACESLSKVS